MTEPASDSPTFDSKDDGEALDPSSGVIRPRHAATLIVVRDDGPAPRVLMGRRSRGHAFMASKWVFPGGRVDRGDYGAPSATELDPEVAARLAAEPRHPSPARLARALALAAVRETFEETGLLLAKAAPARPGAGAWRPFLAQGALPDLSPLSFVARAITPPYRPRRFDARFFMAPASALLSLERQPDCGELDEIAWVTFEETRDLDLPSITRMVLRETAQRLKDPGRPAPFMRFLRGNAVMTEL
ncbi:NUDIX hydrolase [Caulobacter radicis]|uniref:NUDIX hydrolase n=1 Tax=Caulobacter radicis TaxID=2172650 RepID=UPI000D56F9C7|nr:NUDIX hydrolase [Caulobacter radicis]PVM91130.1 NUDIX hydrolase [Caulobacter radicis]